MKNNEKLTAGGIVRKAAPFVAAVLAAGALWEFNRHFAFSRADTMVGAHQSDTCLDEMRERGVVNPHPGECFVPNEEVFRSSFLGIAIEDRGN